MKITVGVYTHNPGAMLERCLKSLIDVPAGMAYDLKLQIGPGSCAENWNAIWEKGRDADFLCIIEDDTAAIKPFWLRSLVDAMMVYPRCGLMMPIETKDGMYPDPGFRAWMNKIVPVPAAYGFCNLFRRKELDLRSDVELAYFNDIDLAYQVQAQGRECMAQGHVMLLHGDPTTDRISNAPDEERQAQDREYLERKWMPDRPEGTDPVMIPYVPKVMEGA